MSAIKRIVLDITEKTPLGYVYAKQGDINSRILEIELQNSGAIYSIPPGATAQIRVKKPDNTQVLNDADSITENVITVTLTAQILAVAGVAVAEIGLYNASGELLTSEIFYIKIVESAIDEDDITSTDEYKSLTAALSKVNASSVVATEAEERAADALENVTSLEAAEVIRQTNETSRVSAESTRGTQETARQTAEGLRVTAETNRATAETTRANSEQTRQTNETSRGAAEVIRQTNETSRVSAESTRGTQETARQTAEGLRVTAETNRATAETTRQTAEAQRVAAEAQRVTNFAAFEDKLVTKYGARRAIGASSATLTRIWDAVGKVANAGIDGATVVNDFDNIYPWSKRRRCNIAIINGEIVVKAYKGEPTFALDGSNGYVAVETPAFYSCPPYLYNDGYEYWGVSAYPVPGWIRHEKSYDAAFEASAATDSQSNSILASVSGAFPLTSKTRAQFRTLARATDSRAHIHTLKYHDILSTLFTVEFATLNTQSILNGATTLSYTNTDTAQATEAGVNRIILTSAVAAKYVVGQTVVIGSGEYGTNIVNNGIITLIEPIEGGNVAVYFDGAAVNITTGNYISSRGWRTGATNNIAASSGNYISNNGKYPCIYRGTENPWGNVWEFIDGVNIKDYQTWICETPSSFADDIFAEPYRALNYINISSEGYVKKMGYDERYPWARLPLETGGGSTTYYSDYYYAASGNRVLFFGGIFGSGAYAGLWFFYAYGAASYSSVSIGARLSW